MKNRAGYWPALAVVCAVVCWGGDLAFESVQSGGGAQGLHLECPTNVTRIELDAAVSPVSSSWRRLAVQRLPDDAEGTGFSFSPWATSTVGFARCRSITNTDWSARRLRMLHNGYLLTVSPQQALDASSTADRHKLYVLHAMLIDPASGRIAATFPPFATDGLSCVFTARTLLAYADALAQDPPPPPLTNLPPETVVDWWRGVGVDEALLTDLDVVDLGGSVVTPGLIDGHLHVSSWSKKLPDEGDTFGYYADISDPAYYNDPADGRAYDATEALSVIVDTANAWLAENTSTGIFLHGFVYTMVEPISTNEAHQEAWAFARDAAGCAAHTPDTNYLLNAIGRSGTPEPAILIHTSGQSCWVNVDLIQRLNLWMGLLYSNQFEETSVTNIVPPGPTDSRWRFELAAAPGGNDLFDRTPPVTIDLAVGAGSGLGAPGCVPFTLSALSNETRTAWGEPVLDDVAALLTNGVPGPSSVRPFYRPIPLCIASNVWREAGLFRQAPVAAVGKAYGQWDPRYPYDSNWYNGAERGLMEYGFDHVGGVWRPTGYAEHYVMRDLLGSVVIGDFTTERSIRCRRNLARWCHRHGITGVQDIMYYRRRTNPEDFHAYEALSYAHDPDADPDFFSERAITPATRTGRFHLRVGMYYYIERLDQVADVLTLAVGTNNAPDMERLRPPASHPEYPGWIRWLGWKLQLDGGTGARTFYSSAPIVKPEVDDPYPIVDENGATNVFFNHSFGLLTMTSEQEQVLDGRASAALYGLVRESDTHHPAYTGLLAEDWTFLREGVGNWVGRSIDEEALAADLRKLACVDMTVTNEGPGDEAALLAEQIRLAFQQVHAGFSNTLQTIARIWYEKSVATQALPHQVACHCDGDAAVELWLRAIGQLRNDLETLPPHYALLPRYWKDALPDHPDVEAIHRGFTNERYRVEHLLNFTPAAVNYLRNPSYGLDRGTSATNRNAVFSTQPALLATDGQAFRAIGFPSEQELWPLPDGGVTNFWRGLPPLPRCEHHMPCPLYIDYDIPFALNTDPPSVRDPRPAVNLLAAISRCPIKPNPGRWLDQTGDTPDVYPPDYLVGAVYPPLGLNGMGTNNMQLSVQEALAAVTFGSAYNAGLDAEQGALASPWSAGSGDGWYADFVIWEHNPLAIASPEGYSLTQLGQYYHALTTNERNRAANAWIEQFRPSLTVVGGVPVYVSTNGQTIWSGRYLAP